MTRGLFLAGAMVVGCNAIFGVDDLEVSVVPEQGGATTAASTVASTARSSTGHGGGVGDCETCARSATGCEAERAVCAVTPDCVKLDQCLEGCDDSVCRTGCLEQFDSGIATLYARYDCERCRTGCKELCPCDGCGGIDCTACVNTGCMQMACNELWNACAMSDGCVDLVGCLSSCMMDPTCEDLCAGMHPSGAVILDDLLRCGRCSWDTCYDVCSTECAP